MPTWKIVFETKRRNIFQEIHPYEITCAVKAATLREAFLIIKKRTDKLAKIISCEPSEKEYSEPYIILEIGQKK